MKTIYNGYGEVRENHDGTVYMKPAPPPPRTPDNQGQISPTRACLVVSERPVSPARRRLGTEQLLETYSVACTMATLSQTRTDEKPHPWEVAWFLWDLAPNKPDQQGDTGNSGYNFYALCVKSNGWELSKQDDKYKGSQRFLASGAYPRTVVPNPSSPVRARVDVSRLVGASVTMRVYIDDVLVCVFTDVERPYPAGRIGLYCEDAEVLFSQVASWNDSHGFWVPGVDVGIERYGW